MSHIDKDIQTILVNETELDRVTFRIASEIDRDYKDSEHLVLLCILKGSIVFTSELMRKLTIPSEVDFMKVSSYGTGTISSGHVNIVLDILRDDARLAAMSRALEPVAKANDREIIWKAMQGNQGTGNRGQATV